MFEYVFIGISMTKKVDALLLEDQTKVIYLTLYVSHVPLKSVNMFVS